jgi:hypothetical protein
MGIDHPPIPPRPCSRRKNKPPILAVATQGSTACRVPRVWPTTKDASSPPKPSPTLALPSTPTPRPVPHVRSQSPCMPSLTSQPPRTPRSPHPNRKTTKPPSAPAGAQAREFQRRARKEAKSSQAMRTDPKHVNSREAPMRKRSLRRPWEPISPQSPLTPSAGESTTNER